MICSFVQNTLMHRDCICSDHRASASETVSLAKPQAQAVLQNPGLSPLVPAAASATSAAVFFTESQGKHWQVMCFD
jgi:hypothetical protein